MAIEASRLVDLYRKHPPAYDLSANLYYLRGFPEWAYRKKAVRALRLEPGDTVVEVGCGTGLNFGLLQDTVGEHGRIIGVDMTDAMLDEARDRVEFEGWRNVEHVHSDAASFELPEGTDGILSTFALTLVSEYDEVIRLGAEALSAGGRWVVADLKLPEESWRKALLPLLLFLFRPFGVTLDLAERHPWDSLRRHLDRFELEEHYLGYTYVAWGER